MDDNKKRNIVIIMLGVIFLMLIVIIYMLITNRNEENYDKLEIVTNNRELENDNDNALEEDMEQVESDKTSNSMRELVDDTSDNYSNVEDDNTSVSYSEDDLISYFQKNEEEIKNSSFKKKFKEYFVEIVDFVFYDTEIKGYTFDELTNTGKLKVISAALKIDSLIENKAPGYKETITSTGNRVYTNAKEKLTELFLNIATNVCKNREEDCNKAKELFGEVKSTCKIGWSFIKGLLKNGGNKIKDWYEIYSGK